MNSPRFEVNPKIVAQHLERRAYVYVRQSSPHQVERNRESGRRQYGLVECAQQLGWPKDSICVIDEDQGRSGSTPHARLGFKDLVTAVGRSEVGIVLGLEISRLARNSPDWANLMYLCRFTDTLVGDETGVYDPTNPTDRMVLGLRGQVSEMELDTSIHRMVEARWSKARRGELLTMSPTGYEVDETGQLVMTSDEAVATAIRAVFGKFDELCSARQVYLFFAEQNLLLPARQKELRSHPVVWVKPSAHRVLYILRHPVYAGAFVFGRTEVIRQLDGSDQPKVITRRARRTQWPVLIRDHHPAYISFDKFLQNQKRLDLNRSQDSQNMSGPVRAGRALLHGLVRCGKCGRQMYVAYGGRTPKWTKGTAYYGCASERGNDSYQVCQRLGGRQIDQVVLDTFLSVIEPAAIQVAILAEQRLRQDVQEVQQLWRLQIEKAQYEAERARRQYDAVEPENRVVARELERRWAVKLAELEQTRKQAEQHCAERQPLAAEQIQRIQQVGADLPHVWQAATTTEQDRKRLLRCLIAEVQLRTEETRYHVRIVWKGGEATNHEVPRLPVGAEQRTSEETVDLVRRLAAEFDDAQIARILNKQGRRGAKGHPFTQEAVRCIRRTHEIPKCPPRVARDPRQGPFTADEAAVQLGVSMTTVHRWLRDGVLPGRQATIGAPWAIVLTDEIRRRLSCGEALYGWVGVAEAARRLGLSTSHVVYLVKTGKLKAMRTKDGPRQCWKIDVSSSDCARQVQMFEQLTNGMVKES